ncbi:S-layer homology domain-containing protein [Enterocloster asparagiformis]|uniref:SLH domain-containing protein n=2 Tax=Enterocloster asparagiformis TaxID=333367 RepID=C0D7B2_9FIRM|nr:S-layer homology domain-containing protein [Enterocloster asparagiformis]EEG52778.1 hypothetical protein CLOSTASPAR_05159 [[Clostridium] asparagiforme DSM 15981]
MIRKRKRLWALLLSAALIVTQLPAVAMAENSVPEDGSITSFEELPNDVKKQTVPVGTELSGLTLPAKVTATVYHVTEDTVIPDEDDMEDESGDASTATPSDADESISGNNAGDSSNMDSGETVTVVTTSTGKISVNWDSDPVYDGDTAGTYVFTADVGGYTLADGAKLPQITVTVSADTAENPTENPNEKPTGKPLPCAKTEGCTLEDGHEGECVTVPPANGALVKTITGWTFVDGENLNEGELPLTGVSMEQQADFDTVVKMLPTQISAEIKGTENPEILDITRWNCDEYKQDGDNNWPLTGEYTFTAALPDGYVCDPLPTVEVLLGGAELFTDQAFDGLTVKTTNGTEATQETDGQIKLGSGTYEISGEWNGTLDGVAWNNKKAVITVSNGLTATVKFSDLTINVGSTEGACAFAVEAGGTANITLTGTNTLTSGKYRAGLEVPENAAVSIDGDGSLEASGGLGGAGIGGGFGGDGGTTEIKGGTVTATGGSGGAGIGGGNGGDGGTTEIKGGTVTAIGGLGAGIGSGYGESGSDGGTTKIKGGTVTAIGGSGAGIGGGSGGKGSGGNGGTIKISGGTVTASSSRGAGIGGGYGGGIGSGGVVGTWGGDGGQFSVNGNAVVFATSNQAAPIGGGPGGGEGTKTPTKGVVFEGNSGTVHGSPELPGDITIPSGSTLTVPSGSTLTVPDGTTLDNKGTIHNEGTINSYGTITGNQPSGGTLNSASATTVTFTVKENGGYGEDTTTAVFGDTVKITATAQGKTATTRYRSAAKDTVDFYIGSNQLGTASAIINGGTATATLELTLSGEKGFVPGSNIITADFGGTVSLNLLDSTGTAELTVNKISQATPSAPVLDSKTDTSIKINSVSGQSYLCTTDQMKPTQGTGDWKSGTGAALEFSGLKQGVMYYLWTYIPGNEYTEDSDLSLPLKVTTLISGVEASVTAPVAGNAPADSATVPAGAGYEVSAVAWEPSDSSFQFGEAYKVTVTLKPKSDYAFAPTDKVSGKLNGHSAVITAGATTGTVILSYQFDKLPDAVIAIQTQPANITVTEGKISGSLIVAASVSTGGSVSYAWYSCDDMLKTNPQSTGVTTASFSIPAALQDGAYYYFCRISATGANDIDSSVAVVTVKKESNNPGGNGGGSSGGSISYIEPEPQSSYTVAGDNISRSVSRSDLKKLADTGKSLTLGCDKAGMTFDPAALKAILAAVPATAGNITFAAASANLGAFPDAAKQIGAHPVYDFTISYKDSKGNLVTVPVNFPAGSAAITLNYTPAAAEVTGSLFMVYVDGKGAVTWLDKSSYDNGKMLAEVPHFSTYGVAYKTPAPVFTDITGHWAKEDIEFVAARGLLSGTGNNQFSPDGTMTRGMFVTALGRLAGVNPDSYKTRSFTDVKADAYYAAYVEWAAQKNIVKGTGDKLFSPDAPVTREQMAVMMVNYAGQMGYSIPTPLAAVTFADSDQISAWAAKEVAAMQRAGIVKGKDGNRFDPQASATRAEVSAVLRRFVESVIDPATATGWIKNDSGHWLYYKGGTALTGWQTIGKLRYFFNADGVMHEGWKQDESTGKWYYWTNAGAATGWREIGGKWYYFDEYGVMAVNTKVDGYEIGPDGARKED